MTPERVEMLREMYSGGTVAAHHVRECLEELAAATARAEQAEQRAAALEDAAINLFECEESPMFMYGGETPACVDCGVACTEDVSDIQHEDGCAAGDLYRLSVLAASGGAAPAEQAGGE